METCIREKPILFSSAMIRAILAGQKTQTRRVMCCQSGPYKGKLPLDVLPMNVPNEWIGLMERDPNHGQMFKCRFGIPGDRLWVRETWCYKYDPKTEHIIEPYEAWYRASGPDVMKVGDDGLCEGSPWKPSIHMPRNLSRITLEITNVRVQRLQEITEEDAQAEGAEYFGDIDYTTGETYGVVYRRGCDSINGKKYPWESNPWVWVIEFKRL
jgi:hypothetical protein